MIWVIGILCSGSFMARSSDDFGFAMVPAAEERTEVGSSYFLEGFVFLLGSRFNRRWFVGGCGLLSS